MFFAYQTVQLVEDLELRDVVLAIVEAQKFPAIWELDGFVNGSKHVRWELHRSHCTQSVSMPQGVVPGWIRDPTIPQVLPCLFKLWGWRAPVLRLMRKAILNRNVLILYRVVQRRCGRTWSVFHQCGLDLFFHLHQRDSCLAHARSEGFFVTYSVRRTE